MKKLKMLIALLIFALPLTINASDLQRPPAHRVHPEGRSVFSDGIEYQSYIKSEFIELGLLITDYNTLWSYSLSLEAENQSLRAEIASWEMKSENWKSAFEAQQSRGDIFSAMFNTEHKLRLTVERRQRTLGWVPWALLTAQTIACTFAFSYNAAR